jgi:putative ABC transport system permease protein
LIRQLLVESLLLGFLGGAGGLVLTRWALDASPLLLPPELGGAALNGRVVLFATGISLLSVLGAGLLPALRGSRKGLGESIKGNLKLAGKGLTHTWGRQLLIAAEVAMAFVLLTSAGLLLKSFSELMASDLGFDSQDLLAVRLELPEERYPDDQAQLAFLHRLQGEVQDGFPEALGPVTIASGLVEDLTAAIGPLVPEGAAEGEEEPTIFIAWKVAPGYFDVAGVPVLQGRGFDERDVREGEKVVILGASVAERYFPGMDPVGRRVEIRGEDYRVVGVAGSVTLPSLARGHVGDLQVFFPLGQRAGDKLTLLARVAGDRSAAVDFLTRIVWAIDPTLPIVDVSLVDDTLAESVARERAHTLLMAVFALTALVLGAVGIYGVVSYSVSQRTREMGIRMALGASPGGVLRRMVMGGMTPVGLGIALGGGGAVILGRALSSLLFQVSPRDPSIFLLVFLTVAAVAFLATWVPARRASGSGPLQALKVD